MVGSAGQKLVIHIQCPFRLVREGRIVLGSADMNVSKTPWEEAFDQFTTSFDTRAAAINTIVERHQLPLTELTVGDGGHLVIEWRNDLRLEVFPNFSRAEEAWRIFEAFGAHYVYPENLY